MFGVRYYNKSKLNLSILTEGLTIAVGWAREPFASCSTRCLSCPRQHMANVTRVDGHRAVNGGVKLNWSWSRSWRIETGDSYSVGGQVDPFFMY